MTIGSLFDGSGTAPLCAAILGWNPLWASEIEPFPVAVTSKRFPHMAHLGDITKINGAMIEPVDVIVGGSPCQNLSVAGNREGQKTGTHSHLFFEMVRIIKEMRAATNGQYPKWIVWENVPGALSNNQGRDFYEVLKAFTSCADHSYYVPEPAVGRSRSGKLRWDKAGLIMADSFSLAWRTLDAKYFGVAQRRRRVFLTVDLTGSRAGKILFERESLSWNPQQKSSPHEGLAAGNVGSADRSLGRVKAVHPAAVYDCRGNGDGAICPNLTGDHQNRITDYTAVIIQPEFAFCIGNGQLHNISMLEIANPLDCMHDQQIMLTPGNPPRKYSVRRLTPLECCRLQGFPDWWIGGCEEFPLDGWYAQHDHWRNVVDPCGAIPGSDTAAYKLWGNGMALPCLLYVLGGIA